MNMDNTEPIFIPGGKPMMVAVFISGSGTNLKALCEEELKLRGSNWTNWQISLVFTNVDGCEGIKIADAYDKYVTSLSSKNFFDMLGTNPDDEDSRKYFDAAVISLIEQFLKPDLIVLAGYRRRLSNLFYSRYHNRILNMYPGDITKPYLVRGLDASIQAIRNHEKTIKATVYFDQPGSRFGIPLLQSNPVSLENYTENNRDEINLKIREEAEWIIFPYAISNLIALGNVSVDKDNRLFYKNKQIPENGLQLNELKDNMI